MTVTYTGEVATCRGLGCFLKLLRRWRGSIYKLVWLDLTVYLLLYYSLSLTYRFLLNADQKKVFEEVVQYCNEYSSLIPLSFVLGFYVSIVMTRWWNQYTTIPFPDPLAVFVSATIHGNDERGRVMRRTIMRYVCLCVTMMFTMISPRVKKRFPTLDHFIDAGLLQVSEKEIIADLNSKFPKYSKHWMPIVWASSIITRARKEGRIRDDFAVKTMIDELNKFRGQCGLLLNYDTISIPLVYTQTVTLAVYSYFMTTLMGHQWVEHDNHKFDMYFPVFTLLQFFFYMGWLKVAESLINPFGDDDDDFEINWMIDRNLQVSYLIVDEMHHDHPELVRDQYWDEVFPQELPHTLASEPFKENHPLPSTAHIAVSSNDQELAAPSSVKIDGDGMLGDLQSGYITFSAKPSSANLRRGNSQASNLGTSVPDSMQRVNSVTSFVRKMFNREDSRHDAHSRVGSRKNSQVELNNLVQPRTPTERPTMKITDQVIEEVDEHQQTLTSARDEPKPSIIDFFGSTPSEPVPIPKRPNGYQEGPHSARSRTQSHKGSTPKSTGAGGNDNVDTISIGSATDDEDDDDDEFTRLKNLRQAERQSRLLLNLAKSIPNASGNNCPESEPLIQFSVSAATTPSTLAPDRPFSRSLSQQSESELMFYDSSKSRRRNTSEN